MSSSFTLMRVIFTLAAAVHIILPHAVTVPALLFLSLWFIFIGYLLTKYAPEE